MLGLLCERHYYYYGALREIATAGRSSHVPVNAIRNAQQYQQFSISM